MASRAEIRTRIEQIEEAIIEGRSHSSIERSSAARWKVSRQKIRNYIAGIYRRWTRQDARVSQGDLARAIRSRKKIISKAWENGDLKTVLAAEDSLAKIQALFSEKRQGSSEGSLTLADLASLAMKLEHENEAQKDGRESGILVAPATESSE